MSFPPELLRLLDASISGAIARVPLHCPSPLEGEGGRGASLGRKGVKGRRSQAAAGVKMIRPPLPAFLPLCGRATISTSRSNAVRKPIKRSIEYSRKLPANERETSGWLIPLRVPAAAWRERTPDSRDGAHGN
jgi:hypothetical protein